MFALIALVLPSGAQAATDVTMVGGVVTVRGDQGPPANPPEHSDILVVVRVPATNGFPYTFSVIESGTDQNGATIAVTSSDGSCQVGSNQVNCTDMLGFTDLSTFLNAGNDKIEIDDETANGARVDSELRGQAGNDTLIGGEGEDIYTGGLGSDTMRDDGASTADAHSYIEEGAATAVKITPGNGRADDGRDNGDEHDNFGRGIDRFVGTPNADTFIGSSDPEYFHGQSGADTITGNGGVDELIGNTENDTINARDGGPDTVTCGENAGDNDTVEADQGSTDTLTDCETVNKPSGAGGLPGVTFPQTRSEAVGNNPAGIVAGVLLEGASDTDHDIATTNSAVSTVSALVNDGNADFTESLPRPSLEVATSPRGIAYGLLNGDDVHDLVTLGTNTNNNRLTVLVGNGTGNVTPLAAQTGLGLSNPRDVVVGLFNPGTVFDLAVANADNDTVSILLGNGDGTFATGPVLTAGDNPRGIAAGFLNADGFQDIVVANVNDGTIKTFLGDGTGAFTAGQTLATGTKPHGIEINSFGSTTADVAVSNYGSDTTTDATHSVAIFHNDGNGTLTPAPGSPFRTIGGAGGQDLTSGDFNGDGTNDLATANTLTDNVSVLEGNPDGTFEPAANFAVGTAPIALDAVPLRDPPAGSPLKWDIAIANFSSNNVSLLMANPPPGPAMQFSAATYEANESAGTVQLTVSRSGGSGSSSVNYAMANGSASSGVDYTASHGTVSFTGSQTSKTIDVPIFHDMASEGDETFTVTLSTPVGGTVGTPSTATVTIHNSAPPVIGWQDTTRTVSETAGNASLTVRRTGGSTGTSSIKVATSPGTAGSDDFTARSDTLTFDPGDLTKTVLIPIATDQKVEGNETFTVVLSDVTGATLTPATATVTITDVPPEKPSHTRQPGKPTGDIRVGGTIRVEKVPWRGAEPMTFTYRWDRCRFGEGCKDTGKTGETYTIQSDEQEAWFQYRTTAHNVAGDSAEVYSQTDFNDRVPIIGGPKIRNAPGVPYGLARPGQRIYAPTGDWTYVGSVSFTYAWFRCPGGGACTEDTGVRSSFYDVTDKDSGATLVVKVYGNDTTGANPTPAVSAPTAIIPPPPANVGVKVQAIEITQGTQTLSLPVSTTIGREAGIPFDHPVAPYSGVTLVERANTAVRVFTVATRDVRVLLYGFGSDNKQLPDSPLSPINIKPTDKGATAADVKRKNADAGYTFALPVSWSSGTRRFVATVIPTENGGTPSACDGCNENNALAVKDIAFTKTDPVKVQTVKLKSNKGKLPNKATAFSDYDRAQNFVPGANNEVRFTTSWVAEIDVSDLTTGKGLAAAQHQRLVDWASANASTDWNVTMGTSGQDPVGMTTVGNIFDTNAKNRPVASVATDSRPLTDVAHELFHALGREHASDGCGGAKGGYEKWSDAKGELLGIGLDFLSLVDNSYRLLGTTGGEWLDFMSYCANEANSWLSPRNWNAVVKKIKTGGHRAVARSVARQAGAPGSLHVSGYTTGGGMTLSDVSSGADDAAPPGDASQIQAVVRDAAGNVVASAPLYSEQTHDKEEGVALFVAGIVPNGFAGQRLDLVLDGRSIASRTRSANAPKVKLLTPRRGQRVRGDLVVSWQATDADKDPMTSRVDYSTDDGRTWSTLTTAVAVNSVNLERSLLAGSTKARVRVIVNDGWNETAITSDRFTAAGSPPSVVISDPESGTSIANDAQLLLAGQATDDSHRDLTGSRLTWFAGRRKIGRGDTLDVTDLRPGTQTIRLVARDARGRTGKAQVRINVRAVAPTFLRLDAPAKVSKTARSVTLTVASSLRARFTAGKTRKAVSRKAKSVRVRIKPGQPTIAVKLTAHGKTTRAVVTLAR